MKNIIWLVVFILVITGVVVFIKRDAFFPKPRIESKPTEKQDLPKFDLKNFDENSINITNKWMPLKPGTQYVYNGTTTEEDGQKVSHRIEINVTDLVKEIGGVNTVVSWDLDYSDNQLVEAELAFFAQDKDGNVWRMGEYPEEYSDGEFVKAPAWIHGIEDARAGIMMQATPKIGTSSYAQGWGPAVDWTDRGQVERMGEKTCVPVKCYEDVLVIAESSASESDAYQLKYYAPMVGNVRVGWRGAGEKSKEVLELSKFEVRSEDSLASVRDEALKLESHGYEVSPDLYGKTKKSEKR